MPPHPWDSPGKNTGVGCHFLLQWIKVKSESEVAQSCPTLCDPMDSSLPGSSIHGIFQARVLEWGAIAFSDLSANYSINFLSIPTWVTITYYANTVYASAKGLLSEAHTRLIIKEILFFQNTSTNLPGFEQLPTSRPSLLIARANWEQISYLTYLWK